MGAVTGQILRYPDPRLVPNVARVDQISRRQVREAELKLWLQCRAHAAPSVVAWVESAIAECQRLLGQTEFCEQAASL